MRRAPLVAVAVIGIGLVAAPAIFQMFSRAPAGGEMIDDFRPFMSAERLDVFDGHLDRIAAAHADLDGMPDALELDTAAFTEEFGAAARFAEEWPDIEADMRGMLATIRGNLDNFAAVDALPPFWAFPWFFVLPGLIAAGLAVSMLRGRRPGAVRRWLLVGLGVGLIAAPAVFQMFSRAPAGAEMIDEFAPIMTAERVQTMQAYFLVLAGAEGDLRTGVRPLVGADGFAERFPRAEAYVEEWARIAADMAPMVGAMADHLESFAGIHALPPFSLFPWFFVLPGVLIIALSLAAGGRAGGQRPTERSPTTEEEVDVPT